MKAYVITTGGIFGLITLAHLWRATEEPQVAKEPWFILLTLLTIALCIWAFRLVMRWPKSQS